MLRRYGRFMSREEKLAKNEVFFRETNELVEQEAVARRAMPPTSSASASSWVVSIECRMHDSSV